MVRKSIGIAVIALLANGAVAAPKYVNNVSITQIILDGENYGGCMVRVSPLLSSSTGCGRRDFVSFDCNGEVRNTKSQPSLCSILHSWPF